MNDEVVYKAQEKAALQWRLSTPAGLLVLGGILLLVANLTGFPLGQHLLPLFIISGLGAVLSLPAYFSTPEKQSRASFLVVPGAFFIVVGLMIFFAVSFSHPEFFAYGWTLIPMSVAAGAMYMRRFNPHHPVHENGRKFMRVMLYIFIGLGLFFELIAFQTLGPWWPLLLVGTGMYMWWQQKQERKLA